MRIKLIDLGFRQILRHILGDFEVGFFLADFGPLVI